MNNLQGPIKHFLDMSIIQWYCQRLMSIWCGYLVHHTSKQVLAVVKIVYIIIYHESLNKKKKIRFFYLMISNSTIMMTSSNGNIFRVTGHFCGEFNDPRWIPRTKASDAELCCFFICVWINGWVNNLEACDLRRYSAHYDVTVMCIDYATRAELNLVNDMVYLTKRETYILFKSTPKYSTKSQFNHHRGGYTRDFRHTTVMYNMILNMTRMEES